MTDDRHLDDSDFQALLQDYAAPIADHGFTTAVLARSRRAHRLRIKVLTAAAGLGGVIALTQIPAVWGLVERASLPMDPTLLPSWWLTGLGISGFVVWAALDRGWSDAV